MHASAVHTLTPSKVEIPPSEDLKQNAHMVYETHSHTHTHTHKNDGIGDDSLLLGSSRIRIPYSHGYRKD